MENLNNTHDTMAAGDRAYADWEKLYVDCGTASSHNVTDEALRLNMMTPEQREVEMNRMEKQTAHSEATNYTTCQECGSPCQIKALAAFNNGVNKWQCEVCKNIAYEITVR